MGILDWDWKAIGAVAGPALALLSLAWQAREKWRRPVIEVEYAANTGDRAEDANWGAAVQAFVRVFNPKPVPILVRSVELQARPARRRWWSLPKRATTDEVNRRMTPVPKHGEAEWRLWGAFRYEPVDVRVVVRHGRRGRRRMCSRWEQESTNVTSVRARVDEQQRQR